jgi:uncharacterized protein (TIGR03067 family)
MRFEMLRLAVASIMLFIVGTAIRADDVPDGKALEGTYTVLSATKGGKPVGDDVVKDAKLTIAGEELTFSVKEKNLPAKFKIDAKAKPLAIDISPTDGPEKGKTFLGIYSFQDGELTLAFTEKGERPKDFSGSNDATVIKLKKQATP